MYTIAVFVGSLRKESFNKKLAQALMDLGGDKFSFTLASLDDVPMYNQDLENDLPAPVARIKKQAAEADGVLFVTPEYNRSIPPVLKNALDWCSRPPGKGVWAGKPAAIAGTSPGAVGTAAVQSHLRSVMTMLGMVVMGQPEIYVVWNQDYFTADGQVSDENNRTFLRLFLKKFEEWITQHGRKK
ncbi:NAD(P)H-dependent oxidoreductase [Desulfovibrio sp. OttesenSCG-928-O18]|nr:NAD(P)H-dependent oxidoreductase [Desulfovibrio sp. OttesenSCG-928-O18]